VGSDNATNSPFRVAWALTKRPLDVDDKPMREEVERALEEAQRIYEERRLGQCAMCGREVRGLDEFRDALSYREYMISYLCQRCQDECYGV
jgi:hypothetical protein